jgi:hypothetical protein
VCPRSMPTLTQAETDLQVRLTRWKALLHLARR